MSLLNAVELRICTKNWIEIDFVVTVSSLVRPICENPFKTIFYFPELMHWKAERLDLGIFLVARQYKPILLSVGNYTIDESRLISM